jgi:type I restriction-modification system DNA methylase subunit
MAAPDSVIKLCETFADHRDHYRSGNYNEAQLRKEFLDPFFAALGWDMDNNQGLAPQYRDVIHEDALRIGPHVKAPDCAFTLHGLRKFFLEAKKPAVNIKTDIDPAYQLRRYAWSAKMPLSILSDFEEFAIYDTRIKPVKGDPSSKARVFYCTFDQYAEKWDEIAAIFSRDAILKGSFDKYAESNKKKKGTAEVDADFLAEIERWRDLLARNLALRNPSLSVRDLNFAVQKTIDRLVFLRICEDRGTEDYGKLRSIANGTQTYPRLLELFRAADARYNSGLFHFSKEKGQAEEPDTLTPHLALDDKVLKDIIIHLYYPDSSYEFSVMPADILGSVYEQFLGKVINLTPGHRAVVEDKPEVKKAGGVFYTPSYIVNYIVKQTVGPLIEGKTPKQIESIRVLDPACGSGSFLIVAYQFLLDWYHQYYIANDPEKLAKGKNPVLVPSRAGGWILTTAERKRILLAHIFGVDIDSQAVEVTKLSLLLKVLEGETSQSVQRELIHQRVLPDLGDNIKCGNSLIGSDFYAQPGIPEMDADAHLRVNVFDWDGKNGFAEIMKAGGFDAVVGNPPYVRSRHIDERQKDYLSNAYETGLYQPDLFSFFVERGVKLLEPDGRLSFIIPNGFLTNTQYGPLREFMLTKAKPEIIVDLKGGVFANASVDTSIVVIGANPKPSRSNTGTVLLGECPAAAAFRVATPENAVSIQTIMERPGHLFNTGSSKSSLALAEKVRGDSVALDTLVIVKAGMKVRKDFVASTKIDSRYEKFLGGRDVKPFAINWTNKWVCYDKALECQFSNQAFRDRCNFETPMKLLVRQVMGPNRIFASLDERQYFCDQSLYVVIPTTKRAGTHYLLGLLTSRLMAYFFNTNHGDRKQTFPKIKGDQIKQLPIRIIDQTNQTTHDRIVALVEKMLDLHKQRAAVKTPHEQTALDRQISATDAQIDRLVYDLYGLTEDEIKLVEGD